MGRPPYEPKSSSVATSPWPKTNFHSRLTMSGRRQRVIASNEPPRQIQRKAKRSLILSEGSEPGTSGFATGPVSSSQLPRGRTRITRGAIEVVTSELGIRCKRPSYRRSTSASSRRSSSEGYFTAFRAARFGSSSPSSRAWSKSGNRVGSSNTPAVSFTSAKNAEEL